MFPKNLICCARPGSLKHPSCCPASPRHPAAAARAAAPSRSPRPARAPCRNGAGPLGGHSPLQAPLCHGKVPVRDGGDRAVRPTQAVGAVVWQRGVGAPAAAPTQGGIALLPLPRVPDAGTEGGSASVEQTGGQKTATATSAELQCPKAQQGVSVSGKNPHPWLAFSSSAEEGGWPPPVGRGVISGGQY